ncbi:MAG: DUF3108 domain-containing protein [Candidatus Omnitrophica bacterium]|jgi:hypothetical protein|nr:DUF3108 domain-containing protein [Candidatus Omnitrophota bacterium]
MRWFKLIFWLVILLIGVSYLAGLYISHPKTILKNLIIGKTADKIIFKVSYAGFMPLGAGVVENNGIEDFGKEEAYHVKAIAWSNSLINFLGNKIEAEVHSFIDTDKFYTLKFMEKVSVGGETKEEKSIIYDQIKHIMKKDGEEREILAETHDPLSLLFYLMRQDLTLGKTIDLNINTNQKNYRFYGKIVEEKTITVGNNIFKAYILKGKVQRRNNSLRHSSEFTVWFIDKPQKVPFLIKIFTNIGPITVRLAEID